MFSQLGLTLLKVVRILKLVRYNMVLSLLYSELILVDENFHIDIDFVF